MVMLSGSNVGNFDIADKFESLSYKWQIVSSCVVLYKNFCAYFFFLLVTLVFKVDVVNIFIPMERELHWV
jgi:hypothetical protein